MTGLNLKGCAYDEESILRYAKGRFKKKVVFSSVYLFLFVAFAFLAIWFNGYPAVFIGGGAVSIVFGIMLTKQLAGFSFYDYSQISGEIEKFHKDIKAVSTTSVGGVGFGTRRQYDSYKIDEMRLALIIKNSEERRIYRIKRTSESHAKYYEQGGDAVHFWGTRYPVRLDTSDERALCPICGEFNIIGETYCARCNNKILK